MTKEEQIRIAHNIKKMREVRGYDQQYMADQLGIKQNTYSRIEKGESALTEERIEQLAKALQTTTEAIRSSDVEKMVFSFNHHNQQGNTFGYVNIYNAADEIVKAFNAFTQPINEELKQMKEEMKSLKKEVVSLRHQNKVQKK
ncbi:MAG: helix-turn-helix transcriptional regulator [Saprospiraceae bacterium]